MNVLQMLTKEWCIHGTLLVLVETPRKTIRPKIVNMIECTPFSSKCLSFFSSLHQHQNSGTQINKTKTTLERCVKMEEKRKSTWGSFSMCQHTNYEHSHPTTKRNGKSHSTHTHTRHKQNIINWNVFFRTLLLWSRRKRICSRRCCEWLLPLRFIVLLVVFRS